MQHTQDSETNLKARKTTHSDRIIFQVSRNAIVQQRSRINWFDFTRVSERSMKIKVYNPSLPPFPLPPHGSHLSSQQSEVEARRSDLYESADLWVENRGPCAFLFSSRQSILTGRFLRSTARSSADCRVIIGTPLRTDLAAPDQGKK